MTEKEIADMVEIYDFCTTIMEELDKPEPNLGHVRHAVSGLRNGVKVAAGGYGRNFSVWERLNNKRKL